MLENGPSKEAPQEVYEARTKRLQFHSQIDSRSRGEFLRNTSFVRDLVAKIRWRLLGARQNSHSHSQVTPVYVMHLGTESKTALSMRHLRTIFVMWH